MAQLVVAPAGGQIVLFWPTTITNSVLQSTTNLASPNWVSATDAVQVVAFTVSNTSPARFFRLYNTNATTGMSLIPAGSFTIGNSIEDSDITDATPTNVYVSAFYIDMNLVSYSQWQSVYSWATNNGYDICQTNIYRPTPYPAMGKTANNPVQSVDWYDCAKWCNARSQLAGLVPVYYTNAGLTQLFTTHGEDGLVTIYANWTNSGYRLPTEAEWEKAARGGLNGLRFPWGNTIAESQANYIGDTNDFSYDLGPNGPNPVGLIGGFPYTSPVGSFAANGYGLYDMTGNVEEWCWDQYAGPPYSTGSPYLGGSDPHGSETGGYRVLRGGYWEAGVPLVCCAGRDYAGPWWHDSFNTGFRCVKTP
jgi:formylglycine-generating enzyme required for sulfatase activity